MLYKGLTINDIHFQTLSINENVYISMRSSSAAKLAGRSARVDALLHGVGCLTVFFIDDLSFTLSISHMIDVWHQFQLLQVQLINARSSRVDSIRCSGFIIHLERMLNN